MQSDEQLIEAWRSGRTEPPLRVAWPLFGQLVPTASPGIG